MRLIDAESSQNRMYVSDLVIEEMKKIPTVDIVRPTRSQFKRMAVQLGYEKVVHCKDCAYWGNEETKVATEYQLFCVCDVLKRRRKAGNCMTNEDFFCADRERRADFVDDNKIGERRADENEPLGT